MNQHNEYMNQKNINQNLILFVDQLNHEERRQIRDRTIDIMKRNRITYRDISNLFSISITNARWIVINFPFYLHRPFPVERFLILNQFLYDKTDERALTEEQEKNISVHLANITTRAQRIKKLRQKSIPCPTCGKSWRNHP